MSPYVRFEFKEADFPKWLNYDRWLLNECISLLLGYEPDPRMQQFSQEIEIKYRRGLADMNLAYCTKDISTVRGFSLAYLKCFELAEAAIKNGSLKLYDDIVHDSAYVLPPFHLIKLCPKVFIKWATLKGYKIHDELKLFLTDEKLRIAGIVEAITELGYDKRNLPRKSKAKIKKKCFQYPELFTESTFKLAWAAAIKQGVINAIE